MRLWVFSDLHQEIAANRWEPTMPPGGFDVLVCAGDVDNGISNSLRWLHDRFPGVPTIYVPGNHDYWSDPDRGLRTNYVDMIAEARADALWMGIDLLIDGTATFGDVRFLGATLWTDFRLRTPDLVIGLRTAGKGMNDYRCIRRPSSTRGNRKIRPEDVLAMHRASRAYVEGQLAIPHDGPTVVVTHHALSDLSIGKRTDMDHAYASDLGDLLRRHHPPLWIHGHVHVSHRYALVTPGGQTRVVCNPRGHAGENPDFDPHRVVEI